MFFIAAIINRKRREFPMEEKVINAALLGLGTVGTGVYKVLKKQE